MLVVEGFEKAANGVNAHGEQYANDAVKRISRDHQAQQRLTCCFCSAGFEYLMQWKPI